MYQERTPGGRCSSQDDLPRLRMLEATAVRAYERLLEDAPRRTRVELNNVLHSHRNRLALIDAAMRRYLDDEDSHLLPAESGHFADLLTKWDITPNRIAALATCERYALAWYHEEAKRGRDYLSFLVTDHLMPEQARTCTIMGGMVRRSLT